MSFMDISAQVGQLATAWEEFKTASDERISQLERKNTADPVTLDKIERLNQRLDESKAALERLEAVRVRPGFSTDEPVQTNEDKEYKSAFHTYLRKGLESGLQSFERKALSTNSDPDGGYLVSSTLSDKIITTVVEISPMRGIASVETISTDSMEILEDKDTAASGWTGETGAITTTANPRFGKRVIPVFELYAQPKATQKLIDDSAVDIENWLAGKISESFAQKENQAFINGDGVGKPRGILSYAAGTTWGKIEQVNSGSSGAFDGDDILELFYRLKEPYAGNATFLMNRATVKAARLLRETNTGQYLWQPGLAAGAPDTLMGIPVAQSADMPVPAASSLSIAVGDFRQAYQIVDRKGIRILRDPFTEKPFVKFYATKRTGGDVTNFEAIKLLKLV